MEVVENWKAVSGCSKFEVSDFGRVRRTNGGKILVGGDHNGYRRFCIDKDSGESVTILVHRVVFESHVRGLEEGEVIDHIDGNRMNNTLSNLRVCCNESNQYNRGSAKQATSTYKGVSYCKVKNKWRAQIKTKGKSKHIGYYSVEADAALAYNEAASRTFGAFAFINKVPQHESIS